MIFLGHVYTLDTSFVKNNAVGKRNHRCLHKLCMYGWTLNESIRGWTSVFELKTKQIFGCHFIIHHISMFRTVVSRAVCRWAKNEIASSHHLPAVDGFITHPTPTSLPLSGLNHTHVFFLSGWQTCWANIRTTGHPTFQYKFSTALFCDNSKAL